MELLTPKQKELLMIAKDKGFIDIKDIRTIYSNEYYGHKIVKRLVEMGYLTKILLMNRWISNIKEASQTEIRSFDINKHFM
jgi:hypothetical protein